MRKPLLDGDSGRVFEAFQYDDSLEFGKLKAFCVDRGIPTVISPLHDLDVYGPYDDAVLEGRREVGKAKKPHRHVLWLFSGKKSGRQVKEMCREIGLVRPALFQDRNLRLRYLCHFDNPEKAFYNPEEVTVLMALNYLDEISKVQDRDKVISEIKRYIRETHELSFARLCDYCTEYEPEWDHAINSFARETVLAYQRSIQYERKLDRDSLDYEDDLLKRQISDQLKLLKQLEDEYKELNSKLAAKKIDSVES